MIKYNAGKCDIAVIGAGHAGIEAALAALNRAPGLQRRFAAENWTWLPRSFWKTAREAARDREYRGTYEIWGGDVDPKCIEIAKANAKRAGVDHIIRFETADARTFAPRASGGIVISNPPYGERVMEHREAEELYRRFGAVCRTLPGWKLYLLSSHTEFERTFGAPADKKRKLYNGMLKCDLFMYTKAETK